MRTEIGGPIVVDQVSSKYPMRIAANAYGCLDHDRAMMKPLL